MTFDEFSAAARRTLLGSNRPIERLDVMRGETCWWVEITTLDRCLHRFQHAPGVADFSMELKLFTGA